MSTYDEVWIIDCGSIQGVDVAELLYLFVVGVRLDMLPVVTRAHLAVEGGGDGNLCTL